MNLSQLFSPRSGWRVFTLIALIPWAATAANHVRVILDTSGSMNGTDPNQLAKLATVLLYDLTNPDISKGDSFETLPFSLCNSQEWTSGPPPKGNSRRMSARNGRDKFAREVTRNIDYTCANTYYYPVLREAVDDLKKLPDTPSDLKLVVLVTDGHPEDPDKGELIKSELIPEIKRHNIRLFVLAIGAEAYRYRDQIVGILGSPEGFLHVPKGENLLDKMIEIYSRSFGYSSTLPVRASSNLPLPLEDNETPEQVAVISYWTRNTPPEFRLTPPPGGQVNNPDGYWKADTKGSYSVTWVKNPNKGTYIYNMLTQSDGCLVAVLRPVELNISFEPQPGAVQIDSTIGGMELPVRAIVTPSRGKKGKIGDVTFAFYTEGELGLDGQPERSNKHGPASSGALANGRYFDIKPRFKDPRPPGPNYEGKLVVELRRDSAYITSQSKRITVYPSFHMWTHLSSDDARVDRRVRAIQRRETANASFEFRTSEPLPHPDKPVYTLQASLDKELSENSSLAGARILVDGERVEFDGLQSDNPSSWTLGKSFGPEKLLGHHEVTLILGKPNQGDPRTPVEIPIHFKLTETPYSSFPVVEDFRLRALIAPPTLWEKWSAWIAILFGLLSILALLWYSRMRPALPPRLCFGVAAGGDRAAWDRHSLDHAPVFSKLLGLTPEFAMSFGSRVLGWIRPVDRDLYRFRPARGVSLHPDGSATRAENNPTDLPVCRTYVARTGEGEFRVKVDYD